MNVKKLLKLNCLRQDQHLSLHCDCPKHLNIHGRHWPEMTTTTGNFPMDVTDPLFVQ